MGLFQQPANAGRRSGYNYGLVTAALLFDYGGTLDADGLPWKERFRQLYDAHGVTMPGETFDRIFYGADDALVGALQRACGLRETVARLAAGVSAGLGVGDQGLTDKVAEEFWQASHAQLRRNRAVLARLRRRHRLGLVSNFYGNLDAVCAETGIADLFDVLVDSTTVGVTKPDPRIFRRATDALGVEPSDTIFVGDSPSRDMAGARGLGMRHVLLVAAGANPPSPCCPGDRIISRLADLDEVLQAEPSR
jgi:putative hydrolase of the HAD superfamily